MQPAERLYDFALTDLPPRVNESGRLLKFDRRSFSCYDGGMVKTQNIENAWARRHAMDLEASAREKNAAEIKTPKGYVKCGLVLDHKKRLCVWFFKAGQPAKLVQV